MIEDNTPEGRKRARTRCRAKLDELKAQGLAPHEVEQEFECWLVEEMIKRGKARAGGGN